MICPSFDVLSAYRDGEATAGEAAFLTRHLPGCGDCRATLSGFEELASALSATPQIGCAAARPLLSAQLDGEVTAVERGIASRHVASCVSCDAQVAAWRGLDAALAALPEAFPSAAADARIRALAHPAPAARPNMGRAFASVAVVATMAALVIYGSLPGGAGPQLGAAPNGGGQTLVAGVAQQIYNPVTGLLYVLQPAPQAAVVVRDAGRQRDLKTILLGGAPAFMAMNARASALYVVDPVARSYTDIDTDRNEIRERVPLNVTGTLTSIAVDSQTGKIVVATASAKSSAAVPAATAAPKAELTIIDPSSKKLETVRQMDVAPTRIVVDAYRGLLFLLGPNSTSVLDAKTYEAIDTIPGAAIAIAAGAERTGVLVERGGRAVLSFYAEQGEAQFDARGAGLFALGDGGFAVLLEDAAGGRIALANFDGGDRGQTITVSGGVGGLVFDAENGRFIAPSGDVVAAIAQGALVAVTATPSPPSVAAVPSTAPATSAPTPGATPAPTPTQIPQTPIVTFATPAPTLFPGAVLSATGMYRYELSAPFAASAMAAGEDGRLWAAGSDGSVRSIDPGTGALSPATQLGGARIARLAYGAGRLFALDEQGKLFVLNVANGRLTGADVPFGGSVVSMSLAPSGRLWLVSSDYNGLIAYDPRTTQFEIVYLDPGAAPTAISVDRAGRVWFADEARHALAVYEPSLGRITYRALPASGRVVALHADGHSNIWLGTSRGAVLRSTRDSIETVMTLGRGVLGFAPAGSAVAVLVDAGPSTLVGLPGATLTVASGAARAFAVDPAGRIWLADGLRAVVYIVEAQ